MENCVMCGREADIDFEDADGVCFDCCYRHETAGADKCGQCEHLSACTGGQLTMAETRNEELKEVLQNLFTKLPHEKHDYSGVGWCAGCGAVLYCSGDGKGRDPCKPDCVLVAAKKVLFGGTDGGTDE